MIGVLAISLIYIMFTSKLISLYKSWDLTGKIFFWLAIIGIIATIIGVVVSALNKPHAIERYITTKEIEVDSSDSQYKNEPWVISISNTDKAVYFGDYDHSCRKIEGLENMQNVSLLTSLNKIWKKANPNETQIINLPDNVFVFLQNDQLILKVIESNGRVQLLMSDAPGGWYINKWYDIAVGINNGEGLKMYINQKLVAEQKIPDLDVNFNNLSLLCLGSNKNKDVLFLIDNLLVSTDPVENHLYHFKQVNKNQGNIKRWILDVLNKLRLFFKI